MAGIEGAPLDELGSVDELIASFSEATRRVATSDQTLTELLPQAYEELRSLAGSYLRNERSGHTLQPTALVHEAYVRLLSQRGVQWQNRAHLLAIAARMMRRILMKHAEARGASKRGGDAPRVALDVALNVFEERDISADALHAALRELEAVDRRQGQIVELRFFGGLNVEETAEVLDISPRTVKREWAVAKAWLRRELAAP